MDNYERINFLKRKCTKYTSRDMITLDDLFLKDEEGKTLFEFMVENRASFNDELLEYLTNSYEYLVYMINNDCSIDKFYNLDLLFDSSKGAPIINILFRKSSYSMKQLPQKVINHLFEKHSGKYFIEDFLNINESDCSDLINSIDDFDLLYNCLSDIGRLDLFKYANEKCLSHEVANGKTMLEGLLANNISLNTIDKSSYKCAEILYKNGEYNELLKFNGDILLNYPTKDNNYLNLLIEKYQNGEDIDFLNTRLSSKDQKSFAIICLTLVRKGIDFRKPSRFDCINTFSFIMDKPAIIHMLEMDKDLTTSLFIDDEMLNALRSYISNLFSIEEKTLEKLNLDELINYLPIGEKLLNKIKSGQDIETKGIYFDDLLKVLDNGETILEYMLKNNIKMHDLHLPTTVEEVLLHMKYSKPGSFSFNEKLLYEKVNDNELLIDVLLKNNHEMSVAYSVKKDLRIIDYCIKYQKFDLIRSSILDELFASINGSYEASKYLDNDDFIAKLRCYNIPMNIVTDILKRGNLKALVHSSEKVLLTKYNNKTILEHLLDANIDPSFYGYNIKSNTTMRLLYKYKRSDLMYNASLDLLVNYPSKDNNFLNYMISCYKKGIDVHFEQKNYISNEKTEDIARCYIQMAQNDLHGFLNDLDEDILLKEEIGGKSLLYYLITLDRDITINKLLRKSMLRNTKINAALKVLSQDGLTDLKIDRLDCDKICRDITNQEYDEEIVSPVEDLLDELRNLFSSDGLTDMELVDALIKAYRYATSVNPLFIEEVKTLIKIKKENPKFHYKILDDGAYFAPGKNCVISDTATIGTLMHETGHAIHYYEANNDVPEIFYDLIEKVRNSPDWLKKVEEYSNRFMAIRTTLEEKAKEIVDKVFDTKLTDEEEAEIDILLSLEKEEIKKLYKSKGYSEATLETILSSKFTKEEFLKQKREIEADELLDFLMRSLHGSFTAIGDFIDGICKGEFRSRVLRNKDGKVIPPGYGHGIRYYRNSDLKYCEMVANYAAIIKSKDAEQTLGLLRYFIGDELVDLLDDFYRNNMLKVHKYEEETAKTR